MDNHILEIDYYKENEDELTAGRRIEPYHLMNGQEGWYVHSWDPAKDESRSFRLDRIKEARIIDETFEPRPDINPGRARLGAHGRSTGVAHRAHVDRPRASPLGARGPARGPGPEGRRRDRGAAVRGQRVAGARGPKEGGDAAVLEPEDARTAILEAAEALAGARARRGAQPAVLRTRAASPRCP